ncbi:MAG TPA: maleylpyruvate isomerase family mycothiol-dependent enzyme [Acidimicrobiales bacterium]|nr:maleylpyruvate isomerase family mycothiol-dependent enzyme [Acidimicrobiales bacterium]
MTARTEIVAAVAEQNAELSGHLSILDDQDWQRPSGCEGWSVCDVVLHLAQTNELATASADGRMAEAIAELAGSGGGGSVDDGADFLVARERGQPASAVRDRWETSTEALRQRFEDTDPHQRLEWVAGQVSARTLATTRLAETWIHAGDIGVASGWAPAPTDRLWHVARLAWRTLPYAFARAGRDQPGAIAFELRGPNGDLWSFEPDSEATTTVRGDAVELCLVAAQRLRPDDASLRVDGPDPVLELVRTYA